MGIKGLVTYCKNNFCFQEYDLVSLAKKKKIEILVDYYGIEQHIMEMAVKVLSKRNLNEYLSIPGGEYEEFMVAFREFNEVFSNLGINMVYVVDGPKGLDKESQSNKEKSWQYRFEKILRIQDSYLNYCKNPRSPYQLIKEIFIRPFLMQDMFKIMVKRHHGTIISLIYGEADYQIAKLRKERNSWAVLTNDSDYFIFEDCPTIQIAFFDLHKDLMMGRYYRSNGKNMGEFLCLKPRKLMVGLISSKMLMSYLNLTNINNLITLSILMGNDYSIDFSTKLRDKLKIKKNIDGGDVADALSVAQWIEKQRQPWNKTTSYLDFIKEIPEATQFIEFSFDFYKCNVPVPLPTFENPNNKILWNYLEERYKNIDISNAALMIFHGYWYQKNCVEVRVFNNKFDINYLLIPIRKNFYTLVLQEGKSTVIEYHVPSESDYTRVIKIDRADNSKKIYEIANKDTTFSYKKINLKLSAWRYFEESWSYWDFKDSSKENVRSLKYFQTFGTDIGFCCYVLRTFYLISTRQIDELSNITMPSSYDTSQLKLKPAGFRAIFCSVIFRLLIKLRKQSQCYHNLYKKFVNPYPNDWFHGMQVCPTSTCLIFQEWLQVIYNLAQNYFGRTLRLSFFFPQCHEFISANMLCVFFEYAHNNGQRLDHLNSLLSHEIYDIMDGLFEAFEDVYEAIVDPFK